MVKSTLLYKIVKTQEMETPNQMYDKGLMLASHINHPSNKWVRESHKNYLWLRSLLDKLLTEYTHRYERVHAVDRRSHLFLYPPKNIEHKGLTPMPQCMPDDCKGRAYAYTCVSKFLYETQATIFVIGLKDQDQYGLHKKEKLMFTLEQIKNIVIDIKSDDEWVNELATQNIEVCVMVRSCSLSS